MNDNESIFSKTNATESLGSSDIVYYADLGFKHAGLSLGNPVSLKISLGKIYFGYVQRLNWKTTENEKKILEMEAKKVEFEGKIHQAEVQIESELKKKPNIESKITNKRDEIRSIEENPKQFNIEKPDKLGLILSSSIIIFLTIYLWIFYSSATYSAFFREIKFTKNAVFNSIFYAKALGDSYHEGFAALLLVLVAPFIFIALGYLIHKLTEKKVLSNYLKIGALITITFIFDVILAFEITQKIYNALSLNTLEDAPPYSFNMAWTDPNFWLIIFAGFVVYIVWGMILNFVVEAYRNFDTVKVAIRQRKAQIEEWKNELEQIDSRINSYKENIALFEGEIKMLEQRMKRMPFNMRHFEKMIHEFVDGWVKFQVGAKMGDTILEQSLKICENYIENVKNGLVVVEESI